MQTSDARVQVTSIGRDQWKLAAHVQDVWEFTSEVYPTRDAALADVCDTVADYFAGTPAQPATSCRCNGCRYCDPCCCTSPRNTTTLRPF